MNGFFNLPPQLVRILLLTVAIVISYVLARAALTPSSFGEYGFYRGAALQEVAARDPLYAGRVACSECHDDEVKKLAAHGHKHLACEGCHGPGQAHVDNPDLRLQIIGDEDCLRCHESNPSRPPKHKQIVRKDHYTNGKCKECHLPHQPEETP